MSKQFLFFLLALLLLSGCADLGNQEPVPPDVQAAAPGTPSVEGEIVFYSERDGNAEIYVMRADGSGQTRVTNNAYEDVSPAWSPDGSQIVFISDRDDPNSGACSPRCFYQLYLISPDGSGERLLLETQFSALHPAWHPDGSRISFDSGETLEGDIYLVDADGSNLQLLIEDGMWAAWSPDGSQLAFSSNRDGNLEIYVADADGSNQRRLTDDPRMDAFPAWSPDGEQIAFMAGSGGTRQVYLMDADGGSLQQVTFAGPVSEDPAWSPDGTSIVFQTNRDGNYEIYSVNVSSALAGEGPASLRRLTDTAGGDYWADWNETAIAIPFENSTP